MRKAFVLVVDDDERYRESLVRGFVGRGFLARGAEDLDPALAVARVTPPDYAVVDLRMPGGSGLTLVDDLRKIKPTMNIVVLTGYGSISMAVAALKRGATNFIPKPADLDDVLVAFAAGAHPPMAHEAPSLARAEWEHIHRVLADCNGNVSHAARVLRIERKSLQRKLAKFPVSK